MVIFHFGFDLNNFHYVNIDIRHGLEWRYFRYVIVTMFVFLAGVSLCLANQNGINFTKLKKRVLVLASASLLVTIGSYTQFPSSWIYFGILHFFLFASVFGLFFIKFPKLAFIVGLGIVLGYVFGVLHMHWLFALLHGPLHLPVRYTQDLANVVPWFGVFLLGMSFASVKAMEKVFNNDFFNSQNRVNRSFSFLGRHSLLIYLLHQPMLFAIFFLLN